MTHIYRLRLGSKAAHIDECFREGFVGVDYSMHQDLSPYLPDEWREFNHHYIPIWQANHPDKSKIAAGLACGALWTVARGMALGDILLCPDGNGRYLVAEITGGYSYHPDGVLPHRRSVRWLQQSVNRDDMSPTLQNSVGAAGTVISITGHAEEINQLIDGTVDRAADEVLEDLAAFAMEKHLEDFLIRNWAQSELAGNYEVFMEDGELVGQQYPTDTGPIDILAISRDRKTLLVIELKRGRASDAVVGQILRYMGYVQDELAEPGQHVYGIVIALEDDQRLRRALAMVPNVDFYRYQISFKLFKA